MSKKIITTKLKIDSINRSGRSDFSKIKGKLKLSDGTQFSGFLPSWAKGDFKGEVVFNTGMTGYIESLTDPSYSGQILVFTYPLIGNYGVNLLSRESDKIQVRGVIVSYVTENWSHSGSDRSLLDWLKSEGVPILTDVDTRSLTKHLRVKGSMNGVIGVNPQKPSPDIDSTIMNSVKEPISYNKHQKKTIILVDCGAKENILRSLMDLPAKIVRVPYDYDYTSDNYDGVVISNGPGDPTEYAKTIEVTKKALKMGKPVFGICLGSQIMGLAAGAKTYKLTFGHRGHNQPCIETDNEKCFVTSQNHGYALDDKSLPSDWVVSFRNLNDDSVEGIEHRTKPFFSVQFHPEATPGPTDTAWLFERFHKLI